MSFFHRSGSSPPRHIIVEHSVTITGTTVHLYDGPTLVGTATHPSEAHALAAARQWLKAA